MNIAAGVACVCTKLVISFKFQKKVSENLMVTMNWLLEIRKLEIGGFDIRNLKIGNWELE